MNHQGTGNGFGDGSIVSARAIADLESAMCRDRARGLRTSEFEAYWLWDQMRRYTCAKIGSRMLGWEMDKSDFDMIVPIDVAHIAIRALAKVYKVRAWTPGPGTCFAFHFGTDVGPARASSKMEFKACPRKQWLEIALSYASATRETLPPHDSNLTKLENYRAAGIALPGEDQTITATRLRAAAIIRQHSSSAVFAHYRWVRAKDGSFEPFWINETW